MLKREPILTQITFLCCAIWLCSVHPQLLDTLNICLSASLTENHSSAQSGSDQTGCVVCTERCHWAWAALNSVLSCSCSLIIAGAAWAFLKQTKVQKQKNIWWHFPHCFHFPLIRWMGRQGFTWRQLWALCGLSCLALLLTVTGIWPAGPVGSEGCLEISLIEIIFLYSLFQCFHCTT